MPDKLISYSKEMKSTESGPGLTKRIPEYDAKEMHVSEWTYDAGVETSFHAHDSSQITYVVRGKARLTIGDNPAEVVGPGDYYYTPSGVKHGMEVIEKATMIFFSPTHSH